MIPWPDWSADEWRERVREIKKFDPDQIRAPAGTSEGGQVQKYSEDQPRDELGRWTETGAGEPIASVYNDSYIVTPDDQHYVPEIKPRVAASLAATLAAAGGFTFQPYLESTPKKGYALSIEQDKERVFDRAVTEADIQKYLDENATAFKDPTAHVGAWVDQESGKIYLDVSTIVSDKDKAIELARKHNQEGIYDLKAGKTIIVKDPNERRKAEDGEGGFPAGRIRKGDRGLLKQVEEWRQNFVVAGETVANAATQFATDIVNFVILKLTKYDPNQPRVPAGSPDGGQWTSDGGGSAGSGTFVSEKVREKSKVVYGLLKERWARVNNKLLDYIHNPHAPEAKALMQELKDIVKKGYSLNADRGKIADLGLPGGPRDVLIVGAGPGGLSAAVMGGTEGLDTLVVEGDERPGGQAKHSSRIENYPGFPVGTSGDELATRMMEQAERVGAETKLGVRVTGISYDPDTGLKTVSLSNGETVEARSVILAGGVAFRKMDFPGADAPNVVYGDAERLGEICKGGPACVVGGSNGAAQAALGVARNAEHVYVLSRSDISKGMSDYQVSALRNHPKITVYEGDEIKAFTDGKVSTKNGRSLDVDGVGLFIGGGADTKWLPPELLTDGRVKTDAALRTSMPGVFAIGDVRHRTRGGGRIGVAVGEGQFAVQGIWDYLDELKALEARVQ